MALFILTILVATYVILGSRHPKAKIEEVYKTGTRIAKKVHGEVVNDLYKRMTSLEKNPIIADKVLDEMERIYSKTLDISRGNSAIHFDQYFGFQ